MTDFTNNNSSINRPLRELVGFHIPVRVLSYDKAESLSEVEAMGNLWQCPLRMKFENESADRWWTLPYDPVVSVSGKNTVVRRNVLKNFSDRGARRGTVKELWSLDDYEINIAGVLMGNDGALPESDLLKLRKYCEGRKPVEVECALFRVFNITRVAIESYELPFTKGNENQAYSLKCYSDDRLELLIK